MRPKRSAREYALSMLERFDRTEQELRSKLKAKEYSREEIEEVLVFLKEYRYINDAEYAKTYIRVYSAKKSIKKICYDLEKKGVDRDLIAAGLMEQPVDEEEQIRCLLKKKGYVPGERIEHDAYQKLAGALFRKGYSYQIIRRVLFCAEPENWD